MACATTNTCCFSGRGRISLGRYDDCCGIGPDGLDPYPLLFVGNATSLSINADVETQTIEDFTTCTGGTYCDYSQITNPTVVFDLTCMSLDNLAKAWAGDTAVVESGTINTTASIRALGSLITFADENGKPVQNVDPTTVTVTLADGTVMVAGTDYEVTEHGFYPLTTGTWPALPTVVVPPASLPAGLTVDLQFSHTGYDLLELFTSTGGEYRLFFEGENAANNCEAFSGQLFRVKLQPASGVPLISKEFATWQVTGTILKDDCKIGAGSKYGTFGF